MQLKIVENHVLNVTHNHQIHIFLVHYLNKNDKQFRLAEPKVKPYFHQISLECIEEIAAYIEDNDIEKMDCDACLIMQEILSDEIEDEEFLEFAIENLEELTSYLINGNLNIRIHRDIEGEMWFWAK